MREGHLKQVINKARDGTGQERRDTRKQLDGECGRRRGQLGGLGGGKTRVYLILSPQMCVCLSPPLGDKL